MKNQSTNRPGLIAPEPEVTDEKPSLKYVPPAIVYTEDLEVVANACAPIPYGKAQGDCGANQTS